MPKKSKKGKGKGKKGKKGSKKTKKNESVVAIAAANSRVWEARLDVAEKSKQEFRDNAKHLMLENDALQTQMLQTEQDTIDVITYLKKQDQDKDTQLERLQQQMRDMKKEHRKEKEVIVEDFSKQINELEEKLGEKMREVELMQSELKMVKEFRRRRGQMQKELDEIKEAMHSANREHKATLARMEQKFFEEKMRLQQEANQKIAELAEKAHTEAISNLDETTKSVYKENVRLTEALNYHMKEGDMLKKERERLWELSERLQGEKEVNELMVQNKVVQAKQQKEEIKQLTEKQETLEQSLSHVVREFEREKQSLVLKAIRETEAAKGELVKLQRVIEMKTREMNKVKKLAKNILDQRTELERFFLQALDQVKGEIAANQAQYRRDAQAAYQQRMLVAHAGKGSYPKIRTFTKSDTSTNSVFKDLEAAERLKEIKYNVTGKVDVSDLTWEQKEKVLRYLFAKMNGADTRAEGLPAINGPHMEGQMSLTQADGDHKDADPDDLTFLTQAKVDVPGDINPHPLIPNIGAQSGMLVEPQAS
ncbi:LOW QUALITY PROTEIN: basal body-orientation factor 1-like [Haliotis rubra]|uniref:LOW QUALITY PROTEIN: basal body-orientation factor 1-like n=1 Tax=Haliotis rubra TaxID=36100 RepID=UPI001EE5C6A4|nr:LOW QUALITY PROTEIN: basal body-orientation factor 1-like [Haliotis rubra]